MFDVNVIAQFNIFKMKNTILKHVLSKYWEFFLYTDSHRLFSFRISFTTVALFQERNTIIYYKDVLL